MPGKRGVATLYCMPPDRGFSDDDVSRIFARASELDADVPADQHAPGQAITPAEGEPQGLTLAELQAIGAEAGISASAIARAVHELSVGAPSRASVQRWAGIPVGLRQELHLDTPVTGEEWTHIVVQLRATFDARGTLREQGAFREWSNGNLQASLEPMDTGHELRLRTRNGNASALLAMAGGLAGFAAMLSLLGVAADRPKAFVIAAMIGAIGVAMGGWQLIALPRWATVRSQQFREVLQLVLANRIKRLDAPPAAINDTL